LFAHLGDFHPKAGDLLNKAREFGLLFLFHVRLRC
jgi:hypothetical protein